MIPPALKDAIVPGSITFLLIALGIGVALLYRRRDGGRAGRICLTVVVLMYWAFSTPIVARTLVDVFTPAVPPILTAKQAADAGAIVVLGAGMTVHRSRGSVYGTPTREAALRTMEAARLYRLLHVPVVVTGGLGHREQSEGAMMADALVQLGVRAGDIIREEQSANTRDHARFVPPLLGARGVRRFVLVTSRQHIRRAVRVFEAAGHSPIPAAPEISLASEGTAAMFLPSLAALQATEQLAYDAMGWAYYFARGWLSPSVGSAR